MRQSIPESIELQALSTQTSGYELLKHSVSLTTARAHASQLATELPNVARYYRSPLAAHNRLKHIVRSTGGHKLLAHVVRLDDAVSGIATAQLVAPKPNVLGTRHGIELSWWHRDYEPEAAEAIGMSILANLTSRAYEKFDKAPLWSVTLPKDTVKANVLKSSGFMAAHAPSPYELGDGAVDYLPRQLWIARSVR